MTDRTTAQLDEAVLFYVSMHRGQGNAMDRWELVAKVFGPQACEPQSDENLFDRRIRRSVERLRTAGHLICDLGDGQGRYMAATADEYWAFRCKYGSHAFPILTTIHKMDAAASRQFGDVVLAMRRKGPDVVADYPETLYQPKLM